ncbi:MAG: hypothetical protein ACRDXX_22440 [Stackebrandtia sp.]
MTSAETRDPWAIHRDHEPTRPTRFGQTCLACDAHWPCEDYAWAVHTIATSHIRPPRPVKK